MDSFEEAYNAALLKETSHFIKDVPVIESVYSGKQALHLLFTCIKPDVGPVNDTSGDIHYKLKISDLDYDSLMIVLTSIRDVFPGDGSKSSKRNKISSDLILMSMGHMSKYVTTSRDKTYKLEIRHIPYDIIGIIIRILFKW